MTVEQIFENKALTAKKKAKMLGEGLINDDLPLDDLLAYAKLQKAKDKATCIEAIEYATKEKPTIANKSLLTFVTKALSDDEPLLPGKSAAGQTFVSVDVFFAGFVDDLGWKFRGIAVFVPVG